MKNKTILRLLIFGLVLLTGATSACVKRKDARVVREMKSRSIEQVFDSNRDSLMSIPGVVGAGIGKVDEKPVIMVMVRVRSDSLSNLIPREIDGFRVVVEETGEFGSLDDK